MKAYDLAELAVRNLRESVLRNSLTTDCTTFEAEAREVPA